MLYDGIRGRVHASLASADDVLDFAFSPEGDQLVTVGEDTLRVWEVRTGRECRTLSLGDGQTELGCVAFTPNGRLLVLGTSRGNVWVWPTEILRGE